ncbi:MAG TPA: hypothetical protein VM659_07575 [Dongiaceae bacterium]|nr:hypothetical protein [Dongiaceae bacterium]
MTDNAIALADEATDLNAGPAAPIGIPTGEPPLVDGLDDAHVEAELQEMDVAADTLRKEGLISSADAEKKKAEVARTRKLFRELSPTDRVAIVKRRRELGVQILNRQLAGAAVVQQNVKLNHTRLRPLFEQWWPYMNRMSLNLQRFGESTFGRKESSKVEEFLERELASLERYVDEQLGVALAYRAQREDEMRTNGDTIFEPSVTLPSLDLDVEAYSRYAMRVLSVLVKFDKTMDQFDFMVWNGIRDQSDVNEEVTRFLRKFHPLGLRSYMTHLKLMTTVRGG